MATIRAIVYNFLTGCGVSTVSMVLFGGALKYRSEFIAPRCAARPKETIYAGEENLFWGWIKKSQSLSYEVLLRGVPGTGTRNGGKDGMMLKVNLDGIVLLRFQGLCMRIVTIACVINLLFVLPVYLTGMCGHEQDDGFVGGCYNDLYGLTDYEITTLANVPNITTNSTLWEKIGDTTHADILARLYVICMMTWIVAYAACRHMYLEWQTLLALRRVFYFERDHYRERQDELGYTVLKDFDPDESEKDQRRRNERQSWIPHPEQRETVVNVGLYSVLVSGLPSSPEEEITDENELKTWVDPNKRSLDWQLEFVTQYFDHCVPNPPGYSSAVAAVTILPSTNSLKVTWKAWYTAASGLRRLQFIRKVIKEKQLMEAEEKAEEPEKSLGIEISDSIDEEEALDTFDVENQKPQIQRPKMARAAYRANSIRNISYQFQALAPSMSQTMSIQETENEELEFLLLGAGPEQTAMYSREFAQSAASCCPYGCAEGAVRKRTLEELRTMEVEALEKLKECLKTLREVQKDAINHGKRHDALARDSMHSYSKVKAQLGEESESSSGMSGEESKVEEDGRLWVKTKGNLTSDSMDNKEGLGTDSSQNGTDMDDDSSFSIRGFGKRRPQLTRGAGSRLHESAGDWKAFESIIKDSPHAKDDGTFRFPGFTSKTSKIEGDDDEDEETSDELTKESKSLSVTVKKRKAEVKKGVVKIGMEALNAGKVIKDTVADTIARESTIAIVTFVNRQSAVAARQCLADGRGIDRWITSHDIPVPPMAEAPPFNILFCRGCCRPVSPTILSRQKLIRKYLSLGFLMLIYVFYTVPISAASNLVSPSNIFTEEELEELHPLVRSILGGFIPGLFLTTFLSLCPVIFKMVANFGSNATSVYSAEYAAMQYFWWFYVFSAYSGSSLAAATINGFSEGSFSGEYFRVLETVANTIPKQISATWMNWIIVRAMVIMPLHYLLQMNTFLFAILGWKCCSRAVRGGGPGGPIPYRLYIDSGLVFLCTVGLAPTAPLLALAALLYFVYTGPMVKRNLVYVYRPNYDAGGGRWPFLFDILISSLVVGQVILTIQMVLKNAYGPAIFAAVPILPCLTFRLSMRTTFYPAYKDGSLFHSSELDGLDIHEKSSTAKREEFRRFLVDAHKAAYVPVCFAQSKKHEDKNSTFTSEPAVSLDSHLDEKTSGFNATNTGASNQKGATLRRVARVIMQGVKNKSFSSILSLNSAKSASNKNVMSDNSNGTTGSETKDDAPGTIVEETDKPHAE